MISFRNRSAKQEWVWTCSQSPSILSPQRPEAGTLRRTCPAWALRPGVFLEPYLGLPGPGSLWKGAALCGEQSALLGVGSDGAKWSEAEMGLIRLGTRSGSLTWSPSAPRSWPHPCEPSSANSFRSKKRFVWFLKSQAGVKCSYL